MKERILKHFAQSRKNPNESCLELALRLGTSSITNEHLESSKLGQASFLITSAFMINTRVE